MNPTATIDGGTRNAQRMTRAKADEMNPGYVFTGNANMQRTPEFYVRIFNVGSLEHRIERPWCRYNPAHRGKIILIPGCKPNEKYSAPFVIADVVQEPIYNLGQGEFATRGVSGKFLAQDAIHPDDPQGNWKTVRPSNAGLAQNEGTNLYRWGVFWTVEEVPSDEELKMAHSRMEEYYNQLIEEAKSLYMGGGEYRKQIGFTHRHAASYYGLEFDWNQVYRAQMECPGCGAKLPVSAVICQKCPATFNWTRALELGLRTVDQAVAFGIMEPQAAGLAKPKKGTKKKPPAA